MTEKIALAAAMVHNELAFDLYSDFFVEYEDIARAIQKLHRERKTITPNIIKLKIESPERLAEITELYPSKEEGKEAISDLKKSYEKRSYTRAIEEMARMNEKHGFEMAAKIFSDRTNSIRKLTDHEIYTAEEVGQSLLKRMSEARVKGAWQPLLGIPHVDELIKGRSQGQVIIILAPPKEGKTAVATQMIRYAAESNTGLFLSSMEMPEEDSLTRPLAVMSGHTTDELDSGAMVADPSLLNALDKFTGKNIFMSSRGLSIPRMYEEVTMYSALHGVELFLYDQIPTFEEVLADKGWSAIQQVVGNARILANKTKTTICLFHQINKEALQKPTFRGGPYQARGGQGALMQATKVIILHRPEQYGLTEFMDGPFKGMRSHGLMEIFVGLGNKLAFGSALVKFIGEQQAIDMPDEYMSVGGKQIPLREARYHGSAPEVQDDYLTFGAQQSSVIDEMPF